MRTATAPTGVSTGTTRFIQAATVALCAGVVVLYRDALDVLVRVWLTDGSYSHGFLILLVTLFLVWRRRREIAAQPVSPTPWPSIVLVPASVAGLTALAVDIELVQQLVVPAIFIIIIAAMAGIRHARLLFFPVAFLYFAIPIWEFCVPWLQSLTATVVTTAVGWLSIPVHIQGPVISIPPGVFEIAEGCSGMRQFLVAVTLATLYGHLNYRRVALTGLLTVVAVAIALVTNWIRVFAIVLIGYGTEMRHALIEEHALFGWAVFAVGLIPLFLLARRLERRDTDAANRTVSEAVDHAVSSRVVAITTVAVAIAAFGPITLAAAFSTGKPAAALPLGHAEPVAGWRFEEPRFTDWRPGFEGADQTVGGIYRRGDSVVLAWVYLYEYQRRGAELAGATQNVGDGQRWRVRRDRAIPLAEDGPVPHGVREATLVSRSGADRLVWYWYRVGGRSTASRYRAKLYQALSVFQTRRDAALIAGAAACKPDCREARRILSEFYLDMYEPLSSNLDATVTVSER